MNSKIVVWWLRSSFFTSRIILSVVLWSKSVCLNLVYFKLQMHIIRSIFYEIQTFSKIICKLIGFLFVNASKAFRSISKSNLKPKVRNFTPKFTPCYIQMELFASKITCINLKASFQSFLLKISGIIPIYMIESNEFRYRWT